MIYGVGINDADYIVQPRINGKRRPCKFYTTWTNMLQRCYCDKFKVKNPTYINCKVVDEWLLFMNFRKWMMSQDWVGKDIDKDILTESREYGPSTCVFVDRETNNFFRDFRSLSNENPRGVSFDMTNNKYKAQSPGVNGRVRSTHLHKEHALIAYRKGLSDFAIYLAERQKDDRVRNAILNKIDLTGDLK